eukprot:1699240-Rhodomonas_salina.1
MTQIVMSRVSHVGVQRIRSSPAALPLEGHCQSAKSALSSPEPHYLRVWNPGSQARARTPPGREMQPTTPPLPGSRTG